MGAQHPEQPARLLAIESALENAGLLNQMQRFDAPKASKMQLARVHTPTYIDHIFKVSPKMGLNDSLVLLDADTAMNPDSLEATLRASGAAVLAVDLVMQNKSKQVFCNTRPPGHHAGRANAAGFCIFNNVAVATAHAMAHYGVQRVAIIDFDVHHGDGTEDIFHDDARVMLCSSFRHPYYPHKGADSGNEHMLNAPLAAGSDGNALREVFNQQWLPALTKFKPQLIIFSAGFDAHAEDKMGGLTWLDEDYAWITQQVKMIANQFSQGRMVSVLEGGYALDALGRSAVAHVKAMIDI
ncbi:MAG TPA: histone deacetylase family protein [Methylotenera sp.]|nr:histone deacetylase family protein [Methylotenera sp.]HPH05281.1 histone deacetylase family protein [Methylotenera sp.]HPN00183.1 histone deacetylase family protein [Methylotenera sp.]